MASTTRQNVHRKEPDMFDHNTITNAIAVVLAVAWGVFVILRCRAYTRAAKRDAQLAATAEGLARGYANIAGRAEANAIGYAGRAGLAATRAEQAAEQQPAWGFGAAGGGGVGATVPRFGAGASTAAAEPGRGGATSPLYPRDPFFTKAVNQFARGRDSVDRLLSGEGHDAVGTTDEQPESDR